MISSLVREGAGAEWILSGGVLAHLQAEIEERESQLALSSLRHAWPGTAVVVTLRPARLAGFTDLLTMINQRISGAGDPVLLPPFKRRLSDVPNATAVVIPADGTGFAEDKIAVARLRDETLLPLLDQGTIVALDFAKARLTTQSFVHALLSKPVRDRGELVFEQLYFCAASPQVAATLKLVMSYLRDEITDK